ncbi:Palmitoyltransferase [Hexamita inflata]|uniref:Palmitoyltransferase n=1 Tax=Hexamita inflata TaxID=28002 RepID=A0ABP1HYQ2_9EUKA
MKVAQLGFSKSGKYCKPPALDKVILTILAITVPLPLLIVFSWYTFNEELLAIFIVITAVISITYIVSVHSIIYASTVDPGVVPPYQVYADFCMHISDVFTKRGGEQTQSTLFKLLSHPVSDLVLLQISKLGKQQQFRSCNTCKSVRPLRSSHSSRAGCCLMRFDHFCPWIGQDVAMFNHELFYWMVKCITVHVSACFVCACVLIGFSIRDIVKSFKSITIGSVVSGAFVLLLGAYFLYSLYQLVHFHVNLLKSGTLTREFIGSFAQNFNLSGQFSLLDKKLNRKDVKHNFQNKFRPVRNMVKFFEELKQMIQKDTEIKNFNDLESKMKVQKWYNDDLQFALEFEHLILHFEEVENLKDFQLRYLNEKSEKYTEAKEYFEKLIEYVKKTLEEPEDTPIKKRNKTGNLLTELYQAYLIGIAQRIPFSTFKQTETVKEYNDNYLCATPLMANFICVGMSVQMLRTTQEQLEEFKITHKELFEDVKFELNLNCCKKEKVVEVRSIEPVNKHHIEVAGVSTK